MDKATQTSPAAGPIYVVEPREVLRFQVERNVKAIFWGFLAQLEDLTVEHDIAMNKLRENLPDEYVRFVDLADHLTDDKAAQLRKRVLDIGNNHLRQINDVLAGFDVTFKSPTKE